MMPGLDGTGLLFDRFVSALPPSIRTLIIEYRTIAASLEKHAHRLELVASAEIADAPRIDVPAYYLQAEGDRLVPRSAAEHLRRLFSHFILTRVPGPHFLLQASPSESAQLIAGILLDAPK